VKTPDWRAEAAAAKALDLYDKDHDNAISGNELDPCPGLKAAAFAIDANKDGRLTKDEIAAKIRVFGESRVGLRSMTCFVRYNGKALADAKVRLIPEEFLGAGLEMASGSTDANGVVVPSIPEESLPNRNLNGMRLGLYRVEISKALNGAEQLPAKYNKSSQLGLLVSPDQPDMYTFELTP
jgi:hypothetical protein